MGLVPVFSAFESAVLGFSHEAGLGRGPVLSHDRMIADLVDKMQRYDVRPPAPRLKTSSRWRDMQTSIRVSGRRR